MRILVSNPILYTAENAQVPKVSSIKDTMIYDLCLAFYKAGHDVLLVAAEDYKPISREEYPFEVLFFKTCLRKICRPNCLPLLKGLGKYIKSRRNDIDLVISSEVFSLPSLLYALTIKKKLIVWHELAKHNNIMKKIPSRVWYNIIARLLFQDVLVVPRSVQAQKFISKYCNKVYKTPVDHGVNLDLFIPAEKKEDYFIVVSQLIKRKRIDGIIHRFSEYIKNTNSKALLYLIGEGEERARLEQQAEELKVMAQVIFLGKMNHNEMLPYLSRAKALLVNTEKDNNLLSVVEALAVCTPVITTSVPYNATYIQQARLGIVDDQWDWRSLETISSENRSYVANCFAYRKTISTNYRVKQFISIYRDKMKERN